MSTFETVAMQYGTKDEHGNLFTEQAAQGLLAQLRQQAERREKHPSLPGYTLIDARMEGDSEQGKVYAMFSDDEPLTDSSFVTDEDKACMRTPYASAEEELEARNRHLISGLKMRVEWAVNDLVRCLAGGQA